MSILRPGITILRHLPSNLKPSTYIRPRAESAFKADLLGNIGDAYGKNAVEDMWHEEGPALPPTDRFFYNPFFYNPFTNPLTGRGFGKVGRIKTMEEGVGIQYNHRIDRQNVADELETSEEKSATKGQEKQRVDRAVRRVAAKDKRAEQLKRLSTIEKELETLRAKEAKIKAEVDYYQSFIDNKTYYTGFINRAWRVFGDVEAENNRLKKLAEIKLNTCRTDIQTLQQEAAPIKKLLLKKAEKAAAREEKLEAKFEAEEAKRAAMTDEEREAADAAEAEKREARVEERRQLREDLRDLGKDLSPAERRDFKKEYYREKALNPISAAEKMIAKVNKAISETDEPKRKAALEKRKAALETTKEAAIADKAKRAAALAKREAKQEAKLGAREDLRAILKPLRDQLRAKYPKKMTEAEQKQFAAEWEKSHAAFQKLQEMYPPNMSATEKEQFAAELPIFQTLRAKYPTHMSKAEKEQFATEAAREHTRFQRAKGVTPTDKTQADAKLDAYNVELVKKGKTAKTKDEIKDEQAEHKRDTEAALKAPLSKEQADRAKQLLQTTNINKARLLDEELRQGAPVPKKEGDDLFGKDLTDPPADSSKFARKTKAAEREARANKIKSIEATLKALKLDEKKATASPAEKAAIEREKSKLTKQMIIEKQQLEKLEAIESRAAALRDKDEIIKAVSKKAATESAAQKAEVQQLQSEKRKLGFEATGMQQMRPTKARLGLGKEYLFVPSEPVGNQAVKSGKEGAWFFKPYKDDRVLHLEIRDPKASLEAKVALGNKFRKVAATTKHPAVKPAYMTHKVPGYKAAGMTELEAREAAITGYKQLVDTLNVANSDLARRLKKLEAARIYVKLEEKGNVTVSTLDKHIHAKGRFKQTDALYTVEAKKHLGGYKKVDPKTKAVTQAYATHPLATFTRGVEEAERWANLNLPTGWQPPTRPSSISSSSFGS